MRTRIHKVLVAGGAGFIGSEFVRQSIKKNYEVVVIDKLTYAGDLARLEIVKGRYRFYKVNICHRKKLREIFEKEKPQIIINFSAETHVDRSISNSFPFIKANIEGVVNLLEISKAYGIKKFIQVSTDEVYGEIKRGKFSENSYLRPNSPYSASKAGADLLIKAYIRTYNFPAIILRPCNNYGPWQYPEKLIPLTILKALNNEKIPLYGRGENIREWLHVSDCCRAISLILEKGKIGEVCNIGSNEEKKNLDVVRKILKILGKPQDLVEFVRDRPGHDFRYSLNSQKIYKEIGWYPRVCFDYGLRKTVSWYLTNRRWLLSKIKFIRQSTFWSGKQAIT